MSTRRRRRSIYVSVVPLALVPQQDPLRLRSLTTRLTVVGRYTQHPGQLTDSQRTERREMATTGQPDSTGALIRRRADAGARRACRCSPVRLAAESADPGPYLRKTDPRATRCHGPTRVAVSV